MANDSPICVGGLHAQSNCGHCVARKISLCSHLDDEGIGLLQTLARRRTLAKGRAIFEQDGASNEVFIITGGIVKLFRILQDGQRQITGFSGQATFWAASRPMATCTAPRKP